MWATIMVAGCKSGASTSSTRRSVRGWGPPGAVYNINLVRPTADGALPMRRIFEDEHGNKIEQLDLWDYGYDARKRSWYRDTMQRTALSFRHPMLRSASARR